MVSTAINTMKSILGDPGDVTKIMVTELLGCNHRILDRVPRERREKGMKISLERALDIGHPISTINRQGILRDHKELNYTTSANAFLSLYI